MNILKKLVFVPFLIISVIAVVVLANQILQDPITEIIGFQISSFFTLTYLSIALIVSALFFALIVTLSNGWVIPIFAAGFSSLIPLMMIPQYPVNMIFAIGFFLSFIVGMVVLLQKLQNYLTFSPKQIIAPTIGMVALLFAITISIAAYEVVSAKIAKDGFVLPEKLIDAAMQLSGANSLSEPSTIPNSNVKGVETTADTVPAINLDTEQIKFIQQNPQLLEQFNITPEQFNAFVRSQNSNSAQKKGTTNTGKVISPKVAAPTSLDSESSNLVKELVKNQLNNAIKPYLFLFPIFITVMLFSSITFGNFILGFFTPLLLWIIFSIMEKSGFVHFVKEMREVKKLVV